MIARIIAGALAAIVLAACQETETRVVPAAISMTDEALGHYCQMNLTEHDGPKAQIHFAGSKYPVWFSQVRDAIAFTRLPEETQDVSAVYVSDMGKAQTWTNPGIDNWVDADTAHFVIESRSRGGMGAPEAIPFGEEKAAKAFVSENGGRIVKLAGIPDDYVLGPVDTSPPTFDDLAADDREKSAPVSGGPVTQ